MTFLSKLAQTDDPPATLLAPHRLAEVRAQVAAQVPPDVAGVLVRNLDRCTTTIDLRAWACVWAIGHRSD